MIDECGAVGCMRIGDGNRSNLKIPLETIYAQQIPHELIWDRTLRKHFLLKRRYSPSNRMISQPEGYSFKNLSRENLKTNTCLYT